MHDTLRRGQRVLGETRPKLHVLEKKILKLLLQISPVQEPLCACLRSDVAVAAGRHLAVHGDPQPEHPVVVRPAGVVRYHHPVSDHRPGGLGGAREQSEGVAGVEDERLAVRHSGEVVEDQPELGPVGEDLSVTSVSDKLLRELRHSRVQVVQ